MLKSCSYCGGIHKRGQQCPSKPKQQKNITHVDKFRWTRKWKVKREHIKQRDKYLCQVCIRERYNTQQRYNFTNIQVHHIIPIVEKWNRRLDDTNLISLCSYHHKMAEDGKIPKQELWDIVFEQERTSPLG
jgi:5-methylcytosine-specific restriction enzyme A